MIVKEAVAGLADFVRCYESVSLMICRNRNAGNFRRNGSKKLAMESSKKRIDDLDKLFEDNVIEKLSDERYARMAAKYEAK